MNAAIAATVLLVVFSGCASTSETGSPSGTTQETGSAASIGNESRVLTFGDAALVVREQEWTGTFMGSDSCMVAGCVSGAYRKAHDVTDLLPTDVPTRIELMLTYTSTVALFGRPVGIEPEFGDAAVYSIVQEYTPAESERWDILLLRGTDPVRFHVGYYNTNPGVDQGYKLVARVTSDPSLVPEAMPARLPLLPGEAITIDSVAGLDGASLFDAAGRIHPLQGDTQIPPDATPPFLLVSPTGSQGVRVQTNATGGDLEPATLTANLGTARDTSMGLLEWTFQVDSTPMAIGVYLRPSRPFQVSTEDGLVEIRGPQGTLLAGPFGCGATCITLSTGLLEYRTALGDPRLAPGEYTVRYDPKGAQGYEIGEQVVTAK